MQHSVIDTHCHSKYSGEASEWFLRKMGCPESFTEPQSLYEKAKARGMHFVTISDHNVIDGCLDIAHLDDTFISCEVATFFPESGCKLDVLTLDITEEQYRECMKLRANIFELVDYLNEQQIFHSLAHPLYNMNGKLDSDHFEISLLLFEAMEVLNGARTKSQNETIRRILDCLDEKTIERLANKHNLAPNGDRPWEKIYTSGSDDHGGLLIGTNATAVPRVKSLEEFFASANRRETSIIGTIGTAHTLAHNIYRAAYLYIVRILKAYHPKKGDPLNYMIMKLLFDDDSFKPTVIDIVMRKIKKKLFGMSEPDTSPGQILTIIKDEASLLLKKKPEHRPLLVQKLPEDKDELNKVVYSFMSDLANMVLARVSKNFLEAAKNIKISRAIEQIPTMGAVHFFLLPYYISYGATNRSNRLIEAVSKEFLPPELRIKSRKKVAMFTDTFDEVNGVAIIVKQMSSEALKAEVDMYIVKSGEEKNSQIGNVVHFNSIANLEIPEYPDLQLHFPCLLDIIDWCEKQEFTCIHAATPGTMGLLALLVAKILHLPFVGTYHTEITDYVRYLTGSNSMANFSSKLAKWFYDRMEVIFAPSIASKMNLITHGISPELIQFIPWGVDMNIFHPKYKNMAIWDDYKIGEKVKLLYAGRISKEKNLDVLVKAFIKLYEENDNLVLILAGDGPYRSELEQQLSEYPVICLGYITHQELATYYASADVFVFPSTTDTFGNVIIEALASGLPVVVSDTGGPKENVIHGETGFITRSLEPDNLTHFLRKLVNDENLRKKMSKAARPSVRGKSQELSFTKYWELHK